MMNQLNRAIRGQITSKEALKIIEERAIKQGPFKF